MKFEIATEPALTAFTTTAAIWGITKIATKTASEQPWITTIALLLIGGLAFAASAAIGNKARPNHGGTGGSSRSGSGRRTGPSH